LEVVYIILIKGYNWKEKVIIALENENDIHYETFFFVAKTTLILKRIECKKTIITKPHAIGLT